EAVASLTRAAALNPNNAQTHNYLGIACSQKGWQEAAEQECRKAIQLDANYGDAHFNLAVIYASQKPSNKESARKHYQIAIGLGVPKDPKLEKMLQ
ncbi:MAG: tetratricopeptide repeat protein, partial [Candidatus Methylacidiphilales bacterium]